MVFTYGNPELPGEEQRKQAHPALRLLAMRAFSPSDSAGASAARNVRRSLPGGAVPGRGLGGGNWFPWRSHLTRIIFVGVTDLLATVPRSAQAEARAGEPDGPSHTHACTDCPCTTPQPGPCHSQERRRKGRKSRSVNAAAGDAVDWCRAQVPTVTVARERTCRYGFTRRTQQKIGRRKFLRRGSA